MTKQITGKPSKHIVKKINATLNEATKARINKQLETERERLLVEAYNEMNEKQNERKQKRKDSEKITENTLKQSRGLRISEEPPKKKGRPVKNTDEITDEDRQNAIASNRSYFQRKQDILRKRKDDKLDEKKKYSFVIHLTIRTTYKQDYYDDEFNQLIQKAGDVVITEQTTLPMTDFKSNIPNIVFESNFEDSKKIVEVMDYRVEYMDTDFYENNSLPVNQQPMRRAFVLKNDWLKYAEGIADSAFEETSNTCVYHQLARFLLNPPTGRPTQFILPKQKTSEKSIFNYFKEKNLFKQCGLDETMDSGVSSYMINSLCNFIKRNMYAFDGDDQLFDDVRCFPSDHYCPIVFYKIHGHFYLIDKADAIRSVAESNKLSKTHLIPASNEYDGNKSKLEVIHIDKFDVENAQNMKSGIYLVKQFNLDEEIRQFITFNKRVPLTKTDRSNVIQIKFAEHFIQATKKQEQKYVIVCVDKTVGERFTYDELKTITNSNGIEYENGGLGSVILSMLKEKKKSIRETLLGFQREEFIQKHDSKCSDCKLVCENLQIDHIIPLASGGKNDISNLQPLCVDCHKQKTIEENESGYAVKDEEISFFNQLCFDKVVNTVDFKTWQFVETVQEEVKGLPTFKLDMRKCRKNIMYFSKYEWPVYCVMDSPKPFSGKIQCGKFYVITENTFPLRGCGWYSQPEIECGLSEGFLKIKDIVMEFIPSYTLPPGHFRQDIDILVNSTLLPDTFEEPLKFVKMMPNGLVGLLGHTKATSTKIKFTLCKYEASTWFCKKKDKSDVYITSEKLDNGETLYIGTFSEPVEMEGTKYPLYGQVLGMEAVELYYLEKELKRRGAIILDRNTDAIRYASRKEIELKAFWDDEHTLPKYQKEVANPLKIETRPHFCRENTLNPDDFQLEWNTQYDYDCSPEEQAKLIIDSKKSIHIDGRAGTGKTYLTNKIIDELKARNIKYASFSPTNKGARLISGNTIHSLYHKFKSSKRALLTFLHEVRYIFIDEISMMIKDFYQLFTLIKRTFKKMKFIIAGDFGQLPPVKDNWNGDFKNSAGLYGLCGGNRIQLTICRRSDDSLFNLCHDVDNVDINQFKPKVPTYLNLAYTHNTRKRVNNECMNRFIQEKRCKTVFIPNSFKTNPKTQDIHLGKGMPVIAHKTNKSLNFLNSETFIVKSVSDEFIILTSPIIESLKIETKFFQKFFYLGFCITIHASQGETFQHPYTIYDWNHPYFCEKAKYVALSRGTSIQNIQIAS